MATCSSLLPGFTALYFLSVLSVCSAGGAITLVTGSDVTDMSSSIPNLDTGEGSVFSPPLPFLSTAHPRSLGGFH